MTTACWVSGWGVHPLPDSTSRALCGRATSPRDGRLPVTYDTRTTFRRLRARATPAAAGAFRRSYYGRTVRPADRRAPLTWSAVPIDYDIRIRAVRRGLGLSQGAVRGSGGCRAKGRRLSVGNTEALSLAGVLATDRDTLPHRRREVACGAGASGVCGHACDLSTRAVLSPDVGRYTCCREMAFTSSQAVCGHWISCPGYPSTSSRHAGSGARGLRPPDAGSYAR